ncbi:hypothetical protein BJ165DRAFT_1407945 [Panaeolus papilionaceus]|nr:hypothetical protein BJ165DRAFT_1407945 [Panaeolus papilionaceus]
MQHSNTTNSSASASSSTLIITDAPLHLGKLDDAIPRRPTTTDILLHTPSLPIPIPNTTPRAKVSPPLLSLTTQTSTSPNLSRMSSRGFVEPHKNHLPRRSKPRGSFSATATPELPQTAPLSQSQSLPKHPMPSSISSVIAGEQAASAMIGDTPRTNTLSPALAEAGSPPIHGVPASAPVLRRAGMLDEGVGLGLALQEKKQTGNEDELAYSSFSVFGASGGNEMQEELDLAMKKLEKEGGKVPETSELASSAVPHRAEEEPSPSTPQPQHPPLTNPFPTPSVLALSQYVHNWTPPPIGLDRRTPRAKGAVGPGWSNVPRRSGGLRNREGSQLRNESPLRDVVGRAQSPLRNESFVGERRGSVVERARQRANSQLREVKIDLEGGEEMRGREGDMRRRVGNERDDSQMRGRSVMARGTGTGTGREMGSGMDEVEMSGSNEEVVDGEVVRADSVDVEALGDVNPRADGDVNSEGGAKSEEARFAFQEFRVRSEKREVGVWLGLLPPPSSSSSSAEEGGEKLEVVLRLRDLELNDKDQEEATNQETEGQELKEDEDRERGDAPARLRLRSKSLRRPRYQWITKDEKRVEIPPPALRDSVERVESPSLTPGEGEDIKPSISDAYPVGVPCLSAEGVVEAVGILGEWRARISGDEEGATKEDEKDDQDAPSKRRLEVLVPRERREDGVCVALCFLLGVLSGWGVGEVGREAKREQGEQTGVVDSTTLLSVDQGPIDSTPVEETAADPSSSLCDVPRPDHPAMLPPPESPSQPAHDLLYALVDGCGEIEISSVSRRLVASGADEVVKKDEVEVEKDDEPGDVEESAEQVEVKKDVEGVVNVDEDDDAISPPPGPVPLTDLPPPSSTRMHRRSMRGNLIHPIDRRHESMPAVISMVDGKLQFEGQHVDAIPHIPAQPTRIADAPAQAHSQSSHVLNAVPVPLVPIHPLVVRTKRMDTPLRDEWMGVLSADGMDVVEEIWRETDTKWIDGGRKLGLFALVRWVKNIDAKQATFNWCRASETWGRQST